MRVWEVSKSNVSVFSQCGHKANNYLEKGPYCISLRQITLVLKEKNNMKDTKDILHTNHWTAASSIKTAVKGLVFLAHNGVSGYIACSYRIYICGWLEIHWTVPTGFSRYVKLKHLFNKDALKATIDFHFL